MGFLLEIDSHKGNHKPKCDGKRLTAITIPCAITSSFSASHSRGVLKSSYKPANVTSRDLERESIIAFTAAVYRLQLMGLRREAQAVRRGRFAIKGELEYLCKGYGCLDCARRRDAEGELDGRVERGDCPY